MERGIMTVHAIKSLGYSGSACVTQCRCEELPCPLLTWLASNLKMLCPELQDRKISVVLVGELRTVLTCLHCPLTYVTEDTLNPFFLNKVIDFLVSELLAARILKYNETQPDDGRTVAEAETEQRVADHRVEETAKWCQQLKEGEGEGTDDGMKSEEREELASLFQNLDLDPSSHVTDACHQVEVRLALLPEGSMEPLLNTSLTSDQWRQVEKINRALLEDYECRRQMMIKRFQVTLQSFAWGEKEQERSNALASVPPLSSMSLSSHVSLPLLLAARKDQSWIRPVRAGLSTAIHKVLMGSVPDRGGRPGEIEPPMPSWEGRRERGKGSGRGGRNQQHRNFSGKKGKKRDAE
ncbi:protein FAM98C [Hypomesus transpacificus]|uniref:protein FAM98C n=1 Tax=Hypomesus transpacificus TaxID=137520 RepID=UPI001F071DFE|nr:protein FAM98C [Hypomesus transpacificus]